MVFAHRCEFRTKFIKYAFGLVYFTYYSKAEYILPFSALNQRWKRQWCEKRHALVCLFKGPPSHWEFRVPETIFEKRSSQIRVLACEVSSGTWCAEKEYAICFSKFSIDVQQIDYLDLWSQIQNRLSRELVNRFRWSLDMFHISYSFTTFVWACFRNVPKIFWHFSERVGL